MCVFGLGSSLALVGYPSSEGVNIKMPYEVNALHRPASHPIYSYWVDAYQFSGFDKLDLSLEVTGIRVFWLHFAF